MPNLIPIYKLLFTAFLNIQAYSLEGIIYILLPLLLLVLSLIVIFTNYRKRAGCNRNDWQQSIARLISHAVFTEEEEEVTVVRTNKTVRLLRNQLFRKCFINALIKTSGNLSGSSRQNLKKLYELLELDNDSVKKLKHHKEHIKAKGLQELAIMEQVKYVKKIFKLTNDRNVLVRNQAQCALVSFYGFVGLRFLNVTAYPVSQWQQIQLLNKLNRVEETNFDPLKRWLRSSDESVVIFSLKLAAYYHCELVYNEVIDCLQSRGAMMKLYALQYIKKIPGEHGADLMIGQYFTGDKKYKLAVLDAMITIGNEKHVLFVQQQLHDEDDDIKAAAAKCLSQLHVSGIAFLQTHLLAGQTPWKGIFLHIKTDHAA